MPKFKVYAKFTGLCMLEVEANSKEEAEEIALNTDGGEFIEVDDGTRNIIDDFTEEV
jgi:hypothetical protein